jgi:hypothetical protein
MLPFRLSSPKTGLYYQHRDTFAFASAAKIAIINFYLTF